MTSEHTHFLKFAKKQHRHVRITSYVLDISVLAIMSCLWLCRDMDAYVGLIALWLINVVLLVTSWRAWLLARKYDMAITLMEVCLLDNNIPSKAWKHWLFKKFDAFDTEYKTKLTDILHAIVYSHDEMESL